MLRNFLKGENNFLIYGVTIAILIRWLVAQWPYSGAGTPPMFGDFEAQRHWMEITVNLDHRLWYRNSSQNDLMYWGIDYPPLSAYHMFLNGKIASFINNSWVQLNTSRGLESPQLKTFMRSTVMISDLVILFPAAIAIWLSDRNGFRATICLLLYPALILIDHGHFQYNCVSLGLTLWSVYFIAKPQFAIASTLFTLALNYKQISMYHSTAFFFFLLGRCIKSRGLVAKGAKLTLIASSVILTFIIVWFPFLLHPTRDALPVLKRLVPVERGLFEDKVANVWCAIEPVIKVKQIFPPEKLFWISALSTLAAILPTGLHLLVHPTLRNFKYSLVTSSLAFFLFSFQVHEKGILLVGIAVSLLFKEHPFLVSWFYFVSTMSLQPLLVKDGLFIPMISLIFLFLSVFFGLYGHEPLTKSQTPSQKVFVIMVSSPYFSNDTVLTITLFNSFSPHSTPMGSCPFHL